MNTLLVCIDFSDSTDKLLAQATKLGKICDDKIVLLHVVEPNPDFVGFETGPDVVRTQWAQTFRDQHRQLEHLEAELQKTGVKVQSLLLQGPPAELICKHAASLQANMILMGTHGHGKLYHLLAGSVSQDVLRHAHCPVLMVPADKPNKDAVDAV